jgi:hypothetical protein
MGSSWRRDRAGNVDQPWPCWRGRGTAAGRSSNRLRRHVLAEISDDPVIRHGVITLIYDKRTIGYSLLRRDYGLLADDAVAAVAFAGDPTRRRPISPRIVGPIGRGLCRPARLPSVECDQVRDHSRCDRGISSGAYRLGLRPVPPPRGSARRAAPQPGDHGASDDDQRRSLPRSQVRPSFGLATATTVGDRQLRPSVAGGVMD